MDVNARARFGSIPMGEISVARNDGTLRTLLGSCLGVALYDRRLKLGGLAHVVLPWSHRLFSNLKRWGLGVYHGLRRPNLQHYLDEFVFRFNRRRTRHTALRYPARHRSPHRTGPLPRSDPQSRLVPSCISQRT